MVIWGSPMLFLSLPMGFLEFCVASHRVPMDFLIVLGIARPVFYRQDHNWIIADHSTHVRFALWGIARLRKIEQFFGCDCGSLFFRLLKGLC